MTACPTCHSKDPKKFYAWSTAFGGQWIPWWECSDEWHKSRQEEGAGMNKRSVPAAAPSSGTGEKK